MRSPAINACGSTRRRAAPPDPIEPRVPVVEDLDERRLVELCDHGGIHRGGRFPGREPYARFHVSVDPNIRSVFHPGWRNDVREARPPDVREFRQEWIPCPGPPPLYATRSEDRPGPLVVL